MKAITRTRYGSPDVLGFDDVDAPTPATGQVLVRVDAASVNRGDALEIRGWPQTTTSPFSLRVCVFERINWIVARQFWMPCMEGYEMKLPVSATSWNLPAPMRRITRRSWPKG